jgi:hypothetical protein
MLRISVVLVGLSFGCSGCNNSPKPRTSVVLRRMAPPPISIKSSMAKLTVALKGNALSITITNTMHKKNLPTASLGPHKSLSIVCAAPQLRPKSGPWSPISGYDIIKLGPGNTQTATYEVSSFVASAEPGLYLCRLEYQDIYVLHMGLKGVVGTIRSNLFELKCESDGSISVTDVLPQ